MIYDDYDYSVQSPVPVYKARPLKKRTGVKRPLSTKPKKDVSAIKDEKNARAASIADSLEKDIILSTFDLEWIGSNAQFLSKLGWTKCFARNHLSPLRKIPVYEAQDWSCSKTPPYQCDYNRIKAFQAFRDDFTGNYFYTNAYAAKVYCEDGSVKLTNSYRITANSAKYPRTLVSRNKSVYTDFPSHFYDHGNAPRNWKKVTNRSYGIEIEMKFEDLIGKLLFSAAINKEFKGEWISERDGSLEDYGKAGDCGYELISPPLSYSKILEQTERALDLANRYNAVLPDGKHKTYYGIHITTNVLGNLETSAKLCCMFNSPMFRPFWTDVSGRDPSKILKKDGYTAYCAFVDGLTVKNAVATMSNGHYRASFVRPGGNVEFRTFQTNYDFDVVGRYLEIVHLLQNFCESSDFSLDNLEKWITFLRENGSRRVTNFLNKNSY